MPACPNCGRQTMRTKDWACQWCGYPLISRAYKVIDKTFKELQEERSREAANVDSDMDVEPPEDHEFEDTYESEPEPERKPEPKRKPEPPPKQKFHFFRKQEPSQPRPAPQPRREPEYTPPPPPESRPVTPPPAPRPAPPPVYRPEPRQELLQKPSYQPAPVPKTEKLPQVPPPAPPIITPPPASVAPPPPPVPEPPPVMVTPPPAPEPPQAKPEIIVEPPAAYTPSVKADDIRDGMEISADDLDALFKADKAGVNTKLTGKTIVLKGVVEKVFIREHLDIRYIVVTGKRKLSWSSRCTFNKEDATQAARLMEGSDVAVRGKYDGYGKNVIFKDCQVV